MLHVWQRGQCKSTGWCPLRDTDLVQLAMLSLAALDLAHRRPYFDPPGAGLQILGGHPQGQSLGRICTPLEVQRYLERRAGVCDQVDTHSLGNHGWDKVTSSVEESIFPPTLLVDDSSEFARVIVPRSRRFLGEPLNPTKSGVLDRDSRGGQIMHRGEIFQNILSVPSRGIRKSLLPE